MFPLNPVEQDTLNSVNIHFTAGLNGPNKLMSPGVQISTKYEALIKHPWVLRAGVDYSYAGMNNRNYPDGSVHALMLGVEGLYYRGTDKLTGYLGLGVVLYKGFVSPDNAAADSLESFHNIVDLSMKPQIGLRATLGLRFNRLFSLEIGLTEVRPTWVVTERQSDLQYSESYEEVKFHDVRLMLGWLLPLRGR